MGDLADLKKLSATGICKGTNPETCKFRSSLSPYADFTAKLSLDLRDQDGNPAHAHSAAIMSASKSRNRWD